MPVFVRPRLFLEADTGFRQSQASLIWRELVEEEEGLDPGGLLRSGPRRRQTQRNREEEDRRTEGRRLRRRRVSGYPDDDCVRYFVLGILVTVFALLVNLLYRLLYKSNWT